MKNAGKVFEQSFKNSIPPDIFYMRLKDSAGTWGSQENTRFTASNPCDCILHYKGLLFLTELKSHKGKSIPFNAFRESQLRELSKLSCRSDELAITVLNFRDLEETYIVFFADVLDFIETNKRNGLRKSFPIEWVREVGFRLPQQKKKVRYRYFVKEAFSQLELALNIG